MTAYAAIGRRALPLFLSLLIAACSAPDASVTVPFSAVYGDDPITCEQDAGGVQLTDLRLYVSELALLSAAGESTPVTMNPDGQWQQGDLALLDFENAAGSCENGTSITNQAIVGSIRPGDYRGLVLTIGVPFDRNHADPLLAEAPLGDSAMHWSWRGGYKFLRAGIRTETDGFWVHVGSTGCEGTIQNITGCSAANRVVVTLPDYQPGQHEVAIDIAKLFAAVDLTDAEATECASGPAEEHCDGVFDALGLGFGDREGNGQQRAIRTRTLN